jgi:hypothetical protein
MRRRRVDAVQMVWRSGSCAPGLQTLRRDLRCPVGCRLGTLVPELQKLGNSLSAAVARYNGLLASLEGKVLPQVRRLENSASSRPGHNCPSPRPSMLPSGPSPQTATRPPATASPARKPPLKPKLQPHHRIKSLTVRSSSRFARGHCTGHVGGAYVCEQAQTKANCN